MLARRRRWPRCARARCGRPPVSALAALAALAARGGTRLRIGRRTLRSFGARPESAHLQHLPGTRGSAVVEEGAGVRWWRSGARVVRGARSELALAPRRRGSTPHPPLACAQQEPHIHQTVAKQMHMHMHMHMHMCMLYVCACT